jgi:hypothetical protein
MVFVPAVSAAWRWIFSIGGCRADAAARSHAAGHAHRRRRSRFRQGGSAIRQIVGNDQIDVMLDNIGLPYSGINIALSDSATVGPMDGEILISLNEEAHADAAHMADLRRDLPKRFRRCSSSSSRPTS